MKSTTKTVASIGALIGATLVIAMPTPSSAATRWDACPAIVDEPLCDLVAQVHTGTNGGGTEPAVVPPDDRTPAASADDSFGCVRIGHVHACAA